MTKRLSVLAACLALSAAAGAARAAEDDGDPSETADSEPTEGADLPEAAAAAESSGDEAAGSDRSADFGHGGQFGLRAALVLGYRMILRYDDSPLCREFQPEKGTDQATFCGHTAPLALDLGLSFAPLDSIEPFLWARLGLAREEETDTLPVVLLGAGARIYTMSDSAFKIFVEPAVGFGLEKGEAPTGEELDYETDLVFHLAAGPQLDLAENLGLYADAGLTMGILRGINSSLELKLGVQGRLP